MNTVENLIKSTVWYSSKSFRNYFLTGVLLIGSVEEILTYKQFEKQRFSNNFILYSYCCKHLNSLQYLLCIFNITVTYKVRFRHKKIIGFGLHTLPVLLVHLYSLKSMYRPKTIQVTSNTGSVYRPKPIIFSCRNLPSCVLCYFIRYGNYQQPSPHLFV